MINWLIILSYLTAILISVSGVVDFGLLGKPREVPAGYKKYSSTIKPRAESTKQKDPECDCVPLDRCAPEPGIVGPRETRGVSFEVITSNSSKSSSGPGKASSSSSSSSRIVNKPAFGEYCYAGDVYCCNIIPPKKPDPEPERYPCGISNVLKLPNYRDIEGQADYGKYPWTAIIMSEKDGFIASGVLIDDRHVLTVAHRLSDPKHPVDKVRLGDWDVSSKSEPNKHEDASVENFHVHKDFNPLSLHNDIAIIRLSKPLKLNKRDFPHINVACLPPAGGNFKGERCWVSGYGKDDENGQPSSILREAEVPIVNGDACQEGLRTSTLGNGFLLDRNSFICAGGEKYKDACTGDGGSGLICAGKDGKGYVAGLVSWGIGCAKYPGVYVNVPNYLPWILERISS